MHTTHAVITVAAVALAAAVLWPVVNPSSQTADGQDRAADWREAVEGQEPEKATFAGGCFWCIEAVYEDMDGVASAVSGYTGGKASTATYEQVVTGETDHREAVRVRYYPSVVSYRELLDAYWRSIDPTDPGGQFADRGHHYTTAIYAHDPQQYRQAKNSKQELAGSGKFDEPIVTELLNQTEFYRAEDRHQNYSRRHTLRYKTYERASGRKGFVERVWGDSSPLG